MRVLKRELWPCRVHIDAEKDGADVEKWLGENLGIYRGRWNAVYGMLGTDFYFRNSKDALMFRLKFA